MTPRSLRFIAEASGARLVAGPEDDLIARITTDSRNVRPGDLFVALAGDKFDGHDFLAAALASGATGVLVEAARLERIGPLPPNAAVLTTAHTREALGRLAARYRADFEIPMVAVGGSNGKTTTKELLASVLRQKFSTLWSEASFNNDVGVPLTLLRLEDSHQAAVLEVGTNHPGELAPLLRMIQPRYGIITSIGREHLEFFGDLAGVAREEGTIGEHLPSNGRMFLPGDSPWADVLAARAHCAVTRVGLGDRNDWRARSIRVGEEGVVFEVDAPRDECSGEYRLQLVGQHQVTNALLALAAGMELGVSPEQLRRGLAECPPPKMRMQLSTINGVRILDDAYNANADSVVAALQTLAALPCSGRRIAVLGDMAELGAHSQAAHEEVGRQSAEVGVDCLVAVGQWAGVTVEAATAAGLRQVVSFQRVAEAAEALSKLLAPGDTVLLKASRATGLEKILQTLQRIGIRSGIER
jgi:UDP-N-acetylmuramoyl-tripeptide--D-alanyl-D-alanine ligase